MPKLSQAVPKYRKHRSSGQAVVTLGGRDFYLGPHGSKTSIQEYDRRVAEYLAGGRQVPMPGSVTICDLCLRFLNHAETYYVKDGVQTTEVGAFRRVIHTVCSFYGDELVVDFGPLALKACRLQWIQSGVTRETVNKNQGRLVRIFKWGVAQEIVPQEIWKSLTAVETLHKGRCAAPDMRDVPPVEIERVEAILEFLSPVVRAMISMQLLTGMRPGEVCKMRPRDIDRSEDVWEYRVGGHKTEHHGRARIVYIGPEAQAVVTPYLLRASDSHCFSAAESREWHREQAAANRVTPTSCGNARGRKRDSRSPSKNQRHPREFFTTASYGQAIGRACKRAWPVPDEIKHDEVVSKAWEDSHRWAPNQLRHTRGTEVRKRFGLEAAQVILGHSKADVTQIYAERDRDKAIEVSRQIG
ncbi:tyrosine-type recombinase/integrase [Rhodopirellula sp. SWK7]|uniref:tyrosine-type recombinase/integrase n=1 Tax=Rhodopirellula sp. SWK7 TaxID=595460 RepID=UPI0005C50AE8|nr:site-specific integrase [Rhodopirellula sp. SWK7]